MSAADDIKKAFDEGYEKGFNEGFTAGQYDAQPGWIPITKKLPEKEGAYLVHVDNGFEGFDYVEIWTGRLFFSYTNLVLAWMPTPKWEGDANGED